MSNKLNIEIKQGATFKRTIQAKDTTGTLINFTGTALIGAIKLDKSDIMPVVSFTTTMTDVNTWEISIAAAVTELLKFDIGVYDVDIVWANGDVDRILEGNAVLNMGVSL